MESMKELNDQRRISVWTWRLSQKPGDADRATQILSHDEIQRASQFVAEGARRRFIQSRAGLRGLLGELCGEKPQDLRFAYSKFGKPRLEGPHKRDWPSFNLSHSGDYALLAAGMGVDLGADLEQERGEMSIKELAPLACSRHEVSWLQHQLAWDPRQAFLKIWTLKEAMLKARSLGLSHDLSSFSVIPLADGAALTTGLDGVAARDWRNFSFAPAPGLTAALAYIHPGGREFDVVLKPGLDYPCPTKPFEERRDAQISLHL